MHTSLKRGRQRIGLLFISSLSCSVVIVGSFNACTRTHNRRVLLPTIANTHLLSNRCPAVSQERRLPSLRLFPSLFSSGSDDKDDDDNDERSATVASSSSRKKPKKRPSVPPGKNNGVIKPYSKNKKNNKQQQQQVLLHSLNMYRNLQEHCAPVLDSFGRPSLEYRKKGMPEHWIRTPSTPDPDTIGLTTKEQVWERIRDTKLSQTNSTNGLCADLYERIWKPTKSNSGTRRRRRSGSAERRGGSATSDEEAVNGLAAPATTSTGAATFRTTLSFTALQFNTLAQGLSAGTEAQPPFEPTANAVDPSKDAYGGFANLVAPQVALDFQKRKWRLLEVIVGSSSSSVDGNNEVDDGNQSGDEHLSSSSSSSPSSPSTVLPDILGLEECDSFHGFFEPLLRVFGYEGIWMPKPNSPGIRHGWYSDGCALFWKSSDWQLESEQRKPIGSGNQVAIMAVLKHRHSKHSIMVVVTHLKASLPNEKTRIEQAKSITDWIHRENPSDRPVLLLGDFNSPPPTSLKAFAPSCLGTFLKHKHVKLQSAYDVTKPGNVLWTTWKTRGKKTAKRMIDYILYRGTGLKCTAALHMLEDDRSLMPLPSLRYPSDHVAIGARFELSHDVDACNDGDEQVVS